MNRTDIIDVIFELADNPQGFDEIEQEISESSEEIINNNLVDCGVLPEVFSHNSSEEKLWAKYSDILISESFSHLGLDSEVLGARGNSADVLAKTDNYSLVADAKTFRLSRTSKNQKDFKVEALDNWRRDKNYSVLVAPLFQYPSTHSQVFSQAIKRNVTLFSYIHLRFLLERDEIPNLEKIWNIGNLLKEENEEESYNLAQPYWDKMDEIITEIVGADLIEIAKYKKQAAKRFQELGEEGIGYWESKIEEFKSLPKEEAIKLLIEAKKIDKKIIRIRKTMDVNLNN